MISRLFPVLLFSIPFLLRAQETVPAAGANDETPKAAEKSAAKPEASPAIAQVALELEWIVMPHADANRLLREKLKTAGDHKALRVAVEEMLEKKIARRMAHSSLTALDGIPCKTAALKEKSCPTAWRLDAAADGTFSASPGTVVSKSVGCTIKALAKISSDNRRVHLNLSPELTEWLGDVSWKAGKGSVSGPVFTVQEVENETWTESGEWSCRGVFCDWTKPADGLKTDEEPPSDGRVLLFVRATVDTARSPVKSAAENPGCMVLCEWIETGMDNAAAIVSRHDPFGGGDAVRSTMETERAAGRATLFETTVIPVMNGGRAKTESVREHPWPATFDLDAARAAGRARLAAEQAVAAGGKEPAKPAASVPEDGKEAPISFETRNLGVEVEAEAFRAGASGLWEVNLSAEITKLQKRENSTVPAPPEEELLSVALRAQLFGFSAKRLYPAGRTVLAATMESKAPFAPDGADPLRGRRVMMLFVKVLE